MRRSTTQEESLDSRAQRYHEQLLHLLSAGDQPLGATTTEYLKSHAITRELIEKYVLGMVPQGERNAGRLVVPYLTRAGVRALKYRCLDGHDCSERDCPKYILEGDVRFYNPAAFQAARNTIGIAEGEVDALIATEVLGVPTVGVPGVTIWTANKGVWKFALRDFDDILVFADGDRPGIDYARVVQEDLGATRAYVVRCDTNMDVSSMVASGRANLLKERAGL